MENNNNSSELMLELLKHTIERQNEQAETQSLMVKFLQEVDETNVAFRHDMRNTIHAQEAIHSRQLETAINHMFPRTIDKRKWTDHLLTELNFKIHRSHKRIIKGTTSIYKQVRLLLCESFGTDAWEGIPIHFNSEVHRLIDSLSECNDEKITDKEYIRAYFKKQRDRESTT